MDIPAFFECSANFTCKLEVKPKISLQIFDNFCLGNVRGLKICVFSVVGCLQGLGETQISGLKQQDYLQIRTTFSQVKEQSAVVLETHFPPSVRFCP